MVARSKSLDLNLYAQVFANKGYFAKVYPMDKKSKCGDALEIFFREFGVPESLTFDGYTEQTGKNTTFMKQIRSNNINHHVIEPEIHHQNPVEGGIRELWKKWFRIMVRKRVPRKLWDYGYMWMSKTMLVIHTSSGDRMDQYQSQKPQGRRQICHNILTLAFIIETGTDIMRI